MVLNSFSGAGGQSPNLLSRRFGSTSAGGGTEPYITGTFGIWFDVIPDFSEWMPSEGAKIEEIQNVLSACCTGVTPPGGTLNKIEFTGLGGVKWAVPGNIDYGNSVSMKFFEMGGRPIATAMHAWVKMIRDYKYGISNMTKVDYDKTTYTGLCYYWTTKPNGLDIEYYACYEGMFPSKDPQDLFSSDVETIGKLDIEIEFNVDYIWHEDWVKAKCEDFAKNSVASTAIIDAYIPK